MAPTTYILPDLPWAVLLEPILQQAPPGATIVVYTAAMRAHVEQALRDADRGDLIVCQQDAPPAAEWWERIPAAITSTGGASHHGRPQLCRFAAKVELISSSGSAPETFLDRKDRLILKFRRLFVMSPRTRSIAFWCSRKP